jgi:hypothetical protein
MLAAPATVATLPPAACGSRGRFLPPDIDISLPHPDPVDR